MSLPADTAARPTTNSAGAPSGSKKELAGAIQALKDLAMKSHATLPSGIADEPLAAAYEKKIQTLQGSLKERDQVVQMLTQRLEQAADQLDRMQRMGSGRGGNAVAGIPPELIENQQQISEQMTQLFGQWEELHAAEMLTRIESRLNDLHELVSSGSRASAISAPHAARESATSSPPAKASDIPSGEPAKSGWEAIKAAMMAGESFNSADLQSPKPSTSNQAATSAVEEPAVAQCSAPVPLPEPPPAIDFDIADHQQLCEAIRVRDEFISTLLRRLCAPDASTELPDWEKLNSVPEDMLAELVDLRVRLHEKLRVAEVDLSLQRAKLAREDAKLTIKAEQVARQMKQLGLSSEEPDVNASGTRPMTESSNTNQGRRWLQFLQRSAGSGTDGK